MLIGTTARPGALTRDGFDRLDDGRLHRELAMLYMRANAVQDDEVLHRRIALLHMWLAQPHR